MIYVILFGLAGLWICGAVALVCLIGYAAQEKRKRYPVPPCTPSRNPLTRGVVYWDVSRKAQRERDWFERLREYWDQFNVTREFQGLSTSPPPPSRIGEGVPHRVNEDGRNKENVR